MKAWGAPHTGPGIRVLCKSEVINDPDFKGFWTTLFLFNRWRYDTYKDNPEAEKQFLDKLPGSDAAEPRPRADEKTEKERDAVQSSSAARCLGCEVHVQFRFDGAQRSGLR